MRYVHGSLAVALIIGGFGHAAPVAKAQSSIVSASYYDAELEAAVRALTEPEPVVGHDATVNPAGDLGPPEAEDAALRRFDDRLEAFNRVMFTVNDVLDVTVLKPTAQAYRLIVPTHLRQGIANVLANAASPVTLLNDVLQGEGKRAQITLVRFAINSTVGVGGLLDVAGQNGFPRHSEDFDQTLAVYGIKAGPYIVLPLFGPTTLRHMVGRAVDAAVNPTTWLLMDAATIESLSPTMMQTVASRESALDQIESLRQTSPDYYAAVRELYFQYREAEIRNGRVDIEELPDIPDVSE
ncbi:MlaA family lipoprotein [Rhodoligotrophos defluvii]|uniref:MlaA family lipoprotein n=1 Tax=Rhodoligotrophos defluvii TaxID=2561934 RepID=UPI0010C97A6E|nr:VacJ family lipoprotein [Rhodoligotrophos defluvii]